MAIRLSSLPPDLQRRLLEAAGPAPAPPVRAPRRKAAPRSGLMKVCSCRCEIFRPDGNYPDSCDGCGRKWPSDQA
jgi:hypothetical protein